MSEPSHGPSYNELCTRITELIQENCQRRDALAEARQCWQQCQDENSRLASEGAALSSCVVGLVKIATKAANDMDDIASDLSLLAPDDATRQLREGAQECRAALAAAKEGKCEPAHGLSYAELQRENARLTSYAGNLERLHRELLGNHSFDEQRRVLDALEGKRFQKIGGVMVDTHWVCRIESEDRNGGFNSRSLAESVGETAGSTPADPAQAGGLDGFEGPDSRERPATNSSPQMCHSSPDPSGALATGADADAAGPEGKGRSTLPASVERELWLKSALTNDALVREIAMQVRAYQPISEENVRELLDDIRQGISLYIAEQFAVNTSEEK